MQISITNGTLTSIQETLSADSGYVLPTSVSVAGATSSYNSNTGVLALSNPTGNIIISASAIQAVIYDLNQLTVSATAHTITVKARATGYLDSEYSNEIIYTPLPKLSTPITSLTEIQHGPYSYVDSYGKTRTYYTYTYNLNIIDVSNADHYDVYINDVKDSDLTVQSSGVAGQALLKENIDSGYGSGTFVVTVKAIPSNVSSYRASDFSNAGSWYVACFVTGTKVNMADGTTKNIEDITYDDELLVWDFYEGKLATAKPCWIQRTLAIDYYKQITLEDGTVLKLVGPNEKCHRLFNYDKQKMLYANECIGDRVYTLNGLQRVVDYQFIQENVNYYNLSTERYIDFFAEGVLTGSRLNNMYHMSNMKYDSNVRLISEEEEAERWRVRESMKKCESSAELID